MTRYLTAATDRDMIEQAFRLGISLGRTGAVAEAVETKTITQGEYSYVETTVHFHWSSLDERRQQCSGAQRIGGAA